MARSFTPKTPGVFTEPVPEPAFDAAPDDAESIQAEPAQQLQPAPDLAEYIQAEIRKGVAAALASNARATQAAAPAHVPDQSEIDPNTITEWQLSKQGYVLPAKYGSFAADAVKQLQH